MPDDPTALARAVFETAAAVRDPGRTRLDARDPATLDAVFAFFDPDIELHEDPRFPEGGLYRGAEAVRRYFEQFMESFEEFVLESPDYTALADGRVLMQFRLRMRGRESGAAVEALPGWIYTLGAGKIVRIDTYLERAEARAAAGLTG